MAPDHSDEDRADQQARQDAAQMKASIESLSAPQLDLLFRQARSFGAWSDTPVAPALLQELYEIVRHGPTSMNCSPARFVFLISDAEKQRLEPALAETNRPKALSAPVIVIIGQDMAFHTHLPRLFPHRDVQPMYDANADLREATAFRNATLQGAYLMIAARALGLDCGPMSGFDNQMVDDAFFADTSIKSNFICCLGHGDAAKLRRRLPRFSFDEVCEIR